MLQTQYLSIDSLKPAADNPREINERQFKILCESLKQNPDYFEARPILCNKAMVIFAGNMRYRAAKELGLTQVPVIIMDISPERERELSIRDNRSNGVFNWDALFNWNTDELLSWGFEKGELAKQFERGAKKRMVFLIEPTQAEQINKVLRAIDPDRNKALVKLITNHKA